MKTAMLIAVLIVCVVTVDSGFCGPSCAYSQGRCVCNYRRMFSDMLARSDGKHHPKRQYDYRPPTSPIKCPYSHSRSMLSTVLKRQYDLYYGCT
ncbi:hypothetical protein KP79_PYT22772 [Mizuhopecten yessoensis]|uniref:Uncharacterized protein n=1 Tax=Mizuhopecten yessoensis TaxID=6573 RepID=A0A210QPE4_MIZYE|nr:hypothetical protein KP79_PYT22772 [Mizuhopecten yessoensis]